MKELLMINETEIQRENTSIHPTQSKAKTP